MFGRFADYPSNELCMIVSSIGQGSIKLNSASPNSFLVEIRSFPVSGLCAEGWGGKIGPRHQAPHINAHRVPEIFSVVVDKPVPFSDCYNFTLSGLSCLQLAST